MSGEILANANEIETCNLTQHNIVHTEKNTEARKISRVILAWGLVNQKTVVFWFEVFRSLRAK